MEYGKQRTTPSGEVGKPLTLDEQCRCLEFLHLMRIDHSRHRFLSNRGFFNIFLQGVSPQQVGRNEHPSTQEFNTIINLLRRAGVETLRQLLDKPPEEFFTKTSSDVVRRIQDADKPRVERILNRQSAAGGSTSEIRVERPDDRALRHLRELEHPDTATEAIALSREFTHERNFHDGYHVLVLFILDEHPLTEDILQAASQVILTASRFDRVKGEKPENMLYECEEMATILSKRITNLQQMRDEDAQRTDRIYKYVKLVYKTWTYHAESLLRHRLSGSDNELLARNWVEPHDFGFLVDIMALAVASRLPLDLLRYISEQINCCIMIGVDVVVQEPNKHRFRADALRMIASPTKDRIPDLALDLYKEIVREYMAEGDTANAMTFVKQGLLINKNDPELLNVQEDIGEKGATRH